MTQPDPRKVPTITVTESDVDEVFFVDYVTAEATFTRRRLNIKDPRQEALNAPSGTLYFHYVVCEKVDAINVWITPDNPSEHIPIDQQSRLVTVHGGLTHASICSGRYYFNGEVWGAEHLRENHKTMLTGIEYDRVSLNEACKAALRAAEFSSEVPCVIRCGTRFYVYSQRRDYVVTTEKIGLSINQ